MPKTVLNDKSILRESPQTGQIELWDTYLPGFGLRISAGGARTYFVMRRVRGKMVRRTIGKAPPPGTRKDDRLADGEFWPAEARDRARPVLAELARGIDVKGEARAAKALAASLKGVAERTEQAAAARTFRPSRPRILPTRASREAAHSGASRNWSGRSGST